MPRDNFVMQERKDKFDALMGVLKGPPGPAGKSAYQIAVDNGFVGTPEEWLASLKGPKGDKGDDGKSAYQAAVDGGYQGTEADFNAELADIEAAARAARAAADDAEAAKTGAESAASHYPKIENGNWWVYSAATGAYVDTGISAEGTQGIDGVSPAVTFAEITGGHTMTVTDKTHPDGQSINILNGQNGTDGVSPAISITDIAGGHRLTITDAAHPQGVSMDIMDGTVGPRGPAGPGVPAGGATGKVLIKKSGADYDTEWGDAGTSDALPLAGGTMSGAINMGGNNVSNLPTPTAGGDAATKGYADGLLTPYRTSAAQDTIDANLMALGLTGASAGNLVRVNAVDANGKPTSWKHVPLCEIKCNKNLLDNWYFVGGGSQLGDGVFPINQRGQSTYSGPGYGIDRWYNYQSNVNIAITSDGITITRSSGSYHSVIQKINNPESLRGKKITASLWATGYNRIRIFANNAEIAGSGGSQSQLENELNSATGVIPNDTTELFVSIYTSNSISTVAKAVKLELGSEQTLAHNEGTEESPVWVLNEIPDYGEELAKCQRYYQLFRTESLRPTYGEDCRPTMATEQPTQGTLTKNGVTYYTLSAES